jgi:DNA-binding transcriptional MerR regulator
MLIGEVSKELSIPIETLRYYDKIGLLTPERIHNNRYYTEKNLMKLKVILNMKKMMFTLDEIKNILQIDEKVDEGFENNYMESEAIASLLIQIKLKYKDILSIENDVKQIKTKLERIINKVELVMPENKYE